MTLKERCLLLAVVIISTIVVSIMYFGDSLNNSSLMIQHLLDDHDSDEYNNKLTNIHALKYYYYDNFTIFTSLQYFAGCTVSSHVSAHGKNSPEHFFYKQLQISPHRVYDCFSAHIFIVPVSFGNAGRKLCGNGSISELEMILTKLTKEIFDKNAKSCWNMNKNSQKYHLIMNGGDKGKQYVLSEWGQLIIGDNTLIPKKKQEGKVSCYIAYGHVSIVNQLLLRKINLNKMNKTLIIGEKYRNEFVDLRTYETDTLPSVYYKNSIKFENRKYGTFFMGQASQIIYYYRYRAKAVSTAKQMYDDKEYNTENDNIWITTPSSRMALNHSYNECKFDMNNYTLNKDLSYPCYNNRADSMLYFQLLSNSKFNLMFSGGDPCSARFYDAISLDVINIVISQHFTRYCLIGGTENGKGINSYIPWNKMFLQIESNKFMRNPIEEIQNVISKYNQSYYDNMLRRIDKYKKYILWDRPDSQSALFLMKNALQKCY